MLEGKQMPQIDSSSLSQLAIAAVLALVGLSVGLQALLKNWKSSSTESALLRMMHTELERMSKQNKTLADEISKLQMELIKLSNQLSTLTRENQKLQTEVSSLNQEISRLHSLMLNKATTGESQWAHP